MAGMKEAEAVTERCPKCGETERHYWCRCRTLIKGTVCPMCDRTREEAMERGHAGDSIPLACGTEITPDGRVILEGEVCLRRQLAQAHERVFALQLQIGKDDDEWMRYHALYVKARREILDLQRDNERLRAAWDEMRDAVLNKRGPLAEMGLTSDQINAVLSVIDDAWPDNLFPSSENPLATYTDGQLYEELLQRGWVATTWVREGGAEDDQ